MSDYAREFMEALGRRNPGQTEFHQAVEEVVHRRQTPAERLLWKLNTFWDGDLQRLWKSRVD